jgi:hypothetical protein
MRRNVDEAVAMAANYLGYETVLGTENVDGVLRMLEPRQWLRAVEHLHTYGHAISRKQIKGTFVVLKLNPAITLHAFLARKPLVFCGVDSFSRPN